jgi:hypothetical protein
MQTLPFGTGFIRFPAQMAETWSPFDNSYHPVYLALVEIFNFRTARNHQAN